MSPELQSESSFTTISQVVTFSPNVYSAVIENLARQVWQGDGAIQETWHDPPSDYLRQFSAEVHSQFNLPSASKPGLGRLLQLSNAVLHSKLGLNADPRRNKWLFRTPSQTLSFLPRRIFLIMTRFGVGILSVEFKSLEQDFHKWLDLVHFARLSGGREKNIQIISRTDVMEDSDGTKATAQTPLKSYSVPDLLSFVLGLIFPSGVEFSQSGLRGQFMSYTGTFFTGTDSELDPSLCFRLRNCFRHDQVLHPTASQLTMPYADDLEYCRDHFFYFSGESAGFVGYNSPNEQFFQSLLPSHVSSQYFMLFLLGLVQKHALMWISRESASVTLSFRGASDESKYMDIERYFGDFLALGRLANLGQRNHHDSFYCRWVGVLRIEQLFTEVRDEIAAISRRVRAGQDSRRSDAEYKLSTGLAALAVMLGVPSMVLNLFSIKAPGFQTITWANIVFWTFVLEIPTVGVIIILPLLTRAFRKLH